MGIFRLIAVIWIGILISSGGCTAHAAAAAAESVPEIGDKTDTERSRYLINAQVGSVAGISVGVTEAEIRKSGRPYEVRNEILEGDEYKVYEVRLVGDVRLECTLDVDHTVYRIDSSSIEIRDAHGLGVKSRLGELKRAYPAGRFIHGIAEGRFAHFLTGTRLIFVFDHNDLDESCFERRQDCAIDDGIVVRSLSIGSHAPK